MAEITIPLLTSPDWSCYRVTRKAGKWNPKMPEPYAPK